MFPGIKTQCPAVQFFSLKFSSCACFTTQYTTSNSYCEVYRVHTCGVLVGFTFFLFGLMALFSKPPFLKTTFYFSVSSDLRRLVASKMGRDGRFAWYTNLRLWGHLSQVPWIPPRIVLFLGFHLHTWIRKYCTSTSALNRYHYLTQTLMEVHLHVPANPAKLLTLFQPLHVRQFRGICVHTLLLAHASIASSRRGHTHHTHRYTLTTPD